MRTNTFGFIGGLILFLISLGFVPLLKLPSLGRWEIVIGALVFLGMLLAAGYLTRGWWAPGLTAVGGLLEIASELLLGVAVLSGAAVGILLTYALSIVGYVLATIGVILMLIGTVRKWREWNRGTRGGSTGSGV